MSQNDAVNYPKIRVRTDGRVEVIVYNQGKRMRLQNGSSFGIDLKPNSFPPQQRIIQANILASKIYSKMILGYDPCTKPILEKSEFSSDLECVRESLKDKLKQGFSLHYQKALKLAFNRLSRVSKSGVVNSDTILNALSNYENNVSYNTVRRNLNVLCSNAIRYGLNQNPVQSIPRKKENAQLNKPIKDVAMLLNEVKSFNYNLYVCCLLTYGCLLRPHREIRELTWGDFTKDLKYIRLAGNRNKSGRNRIVPVPEYIKVVLKQNEEDSINIFSQSKKPYDRDYFKGLWSRFKKQSKLLEKDQTLYSFRHTGAINVYERTGSIEKLKTVMGHSSIAVSLTYLRGLDVPELEEADMPYL